MGQGPGDAETAELQNRFGLPDSSYTAVEQFLTSDGMKLVKVDKYYDSRQVCVDATVGEAEKAFATRIFQSADDKMYANICDPAVPANPPIIAVSGLNNYPTPGRVDMWPPPCR
jgi:subtilase family serine protease